MDIKELKERIENNTLESDVYYIEYAYTDFVVNQYLKKYIDDNNLEVVSVDTVDDIPLPTLFNDLKDTVVLLKTDYFSTEMWQDLPFVDLNLWVVCKKFDNDIKKDNNYIKIPKLEKWHIIDYILSSVDVTKEQAEIIYDTFKDDLYKLDLELNKLKYCSFDECYSQLVIEKSPYKAFDLVNAFIKRDVQSLAKIYRKIDGMDFNVFGLITLLLKSFKNVIDIQTGKNVTAESLGMNGKQFWVIQKYSCGFYSKEELAYIYEFLCSLDCNIKKGLLPVELMFDYIICKIFNL